MRISGTGRIASALAVVMALASSPALAEGKAALEDPRELSPLNAGLAVAGVAVLILLLAAASD